MGANITDLVRYIANYESPEIGLQGRLLTKTTGALGSFRPGYLAHYIRTRNIIFEACLFWSMA